MFGFFLPAYRSCKNSGRRAERLRENQWVADGEANLTTIPFQRAYGDLDVTPAKERRVAWRYIQPGKPSQDALAEKTGKQPLTNRQFSRYACHAPDTVRSIGMIQLS